MNRMRQESETKGREERRPGRDCVTQMRLLRSRPDWLAGALREMGIGEDDDAVVEDE